MKLTIFAATGGIGRHLLDQSLAAGHDVTAVVRDPRELPPEVRAVTADLAAAGPDELVPAVAGADAVLSGLGPRSRADAGIASRGTGHRPGDAGDLALMEDVLRDSGLDWTVVRPPRLTDRPGTGTYRTALGRNLRRGFLVPRADVAHLMLASLDRPETVGQAIGIAS